MKLPFLKEKPQGWNKTTFVNERLSNERKLERPLGSIIGKYLPILQRLSPETFDSRSRYLNRPIIGRDSRINGGVYLGEIEREALVVDWEHSPNIQAMYLKILNTCVDWEEYDKTGKMTYHKNDHDDKPGLLRAALQIVQEEMSIIDPQMTDVYVERNGWEQDKKVNVDHFVKDGIGVCRHRALVLGVIIERMILEGLLGGKVSIDRNTAEYRRGYGGHAWIRYTTSSGQINILDPMHGYIGSIVNVKNDRLRRKDTWDYLRPSD